MSAAKNVEGQGVLRLAFSYPLSTIGAF